MLVGESLSRRHRGTIPGEASQGGRLSYAIVCSSEPPRRFQARSVLDTGRSVARYFSGQMSRPGGAWPSSLRGGLPGISPHPRSPGVPWVWHDAPLRVFLLQRIGTPHTLYLFQKYDIATGMLRGNDRRRPHSPPPMRQNSPIQSLGGVVPTCPYSGSLVPAAFATGSI